MSAPFDTLKLARRFEAAGFDPKQAGDMAEAIAEATIAADLATKADIAALAAATKRDLRELGKDLKLWLGTTIVVVAGLLFTALHLWPAH
jgi:hypothetical protein